jgi:hypothetical protein
MIGGAKKLTVVKYTDSFGSEHYRAGAVRRDGRTDDAAKFDRWWNKKRRGDA